MIPATFPDIPVNDLAVAAVQGYSSWPATKGDLLAEVLKQHNVRAQIRVIGATFPGWGWDRAIETHVLVVIANELHSRDLKGVRAFQSWPAGGGVYYWEPFSGFDLKKLWTLKKAATTRKKQAELAQERIDLWIEYLTKTGAATTSAVYAAVVGDPRFR